MYALVVWDRPSEQLKTNERQQRQQETSRLDRTDQLTNWTQSERCSLTKTSANQTLERELSGTDQRESIQQEPVYQKRWMGLMFAAIRLKDVSGLAHIPKFFFLIQVGGFRCYWSLVKLIL